MNDLHHRRKHHFSGPSILTKRIELNMGPYSKLTWLACLSLVGQNAVAQVIDPAATPLPAPYSGFNYIGCYTDSVSQRTLIDDPQNIPGGGPNMTIQNCIDGCLRVDLGYVFAGMEYSSEVSSRAFQGKSTHSLSVQMWASSGLQGSQAKRQLKLQLCMLW